MNCPVCGAPNEDGALVCRACGAPLSPAAQPATETPAASAPSFEQPAQPQPAPAPEAPAAPVSPVSAPKQKSKALPIVIAVAAVLIAAGVAVALLFKFGILPPGAKEKNDADNGTSETQSAENATQDTAPSESEPTTEPEPALPKDTALYYKNAPLDAFYAIEYRLQSWPAALSAEEMAKETVENLENTYCFYEKAVAEGMELSEDSLAQLEADISYFSDMAADYGDKDLNACFLRLFGTPKVTEETMREYLRIHYLSGQYLENMMNNAYDSVSMEKITAETDKIEAFKQVDIRLYGFEKTDGAREKAEEMLSRITDEASFAALCREYCDEGQRLVFENDEASLAKAIKEENVRAGIGEDLADWLFSGERVYGDKRIEETADYIYVLMVKKPAYLEDDPLASARHILLLFEEPDEQQDPTGLPTQDLNGDEITTDGTGCSLEEVRATYQKAKEIYDMYMAGPRTEEAFAALADEYSDDTASTTTDDGREGGGLYTDIEKGMMVAPFEEWVYDASRKPGDVGIIKTNYGWHVMYYVSRHSEPVWVEAIRAELGNGIYAKAYEDATKAFRGSLQKGEAYNDFCDALYQNYLKAYDDSEAD